MSLETIETPLTKLLGIKYPIMLAGMNKASGPELAAAVTNAGGLGVIGGVGYTPKVLKRTIDTLKKNLNNPNAPFGVDLLLPKVGGNARKTNYDYTKGKLDELINITIESGAKLFVSAVGVPPKKIVDKLHNNNILVMNMIGAPKHVKYVLDAGCDIICAQGGEAGGHTGNIATTVLLPKVVDLCKNKKSAFTGQKIHVVGAGGIYDGRGLAMALNYGCESVWIGTRFVCAKESGASTAHKLSILNAKCDDTYRTLVYTGRPCRIVHNKYVDNWKKNRKNEMEKCLKNGIVPYTVDMKNSDMMKNFNFDEFEPHFSGQIAGCVDKILTAKEIIDDIMKEYIQVYRKQNNRIKVISKL